MIISACVVNFKYLIFILLNKRWFIKSEILYLLSRIYCNRPGKPIEFPEI